MIDDRYLRGTLSPGPPGVYRFEGLKRGRKKKGRARCKALPPHRPAASVLGSLPSVALSPGRPGRIVSRPPPMLKSWIGTGLTSRKA